MANESGQQQAPTASSPVRPRVHPTPAGLAEPALAANIVSVSQEPAGFLLTFYSVPADALEAPSVKQQIQQQQQGKQSGGVIDVTIESHPAAKLFLPITTVAGLMQLLNDNMRAWSDSYARDLRNFIDNVKRADGGEGKKANA